jgi:hypothetical protein
VTRDDDDDDDDNNNNNNNNNNNYYYYLNVCRDQLVQESGRRRVITNVL